MYKRLKKELEDLQESINYLHDLYFHNDDIFTELEMELLKQQREISYKLKHILKARLSLYDDYKPIKENNIQLSLEVSNE